MIQTRFTTNVAAILNGGFDNTANLSADDGSYASAEIAYSNTRVIRCSGFDFSIPGGSIINSITIYGKHKVSGSTFNDYIVYRSISIDREHGYESFHDGTSPTDDTVINFGFHYDLTASDLNDDALMVEIEAGNSFSGRTFYIDYVKAVVDYTPPAVTGFSQII